MTIESRLPILINPPLTNHMSKTEVQFYFIQAARSAPTGSLFTAAYYVCKSGSESKDISHNINHGFVP